MTDTEKLVEVLYQGEERRAVPPPLYKDCLGYQLNRMNAERAHSELKNATLEHKIIIDGVATRMTTMEERFDELKAEVKKDIKSIKDDIPKLFDSAMDKLFARIGRWMLIGLGVILVVVVLAVTRPVIYKALEEVQEKVLQVDVIK